MAKRSILSFFIIMLISAGLVFRIAYISESLTLSASSEKSSRLLNVAETRGMIYDRNMRPLVNRNVSTVLVVNPTADAMAELRAELSQEEYAKAIDEAKSGKPFVLACNTYSGDCDDIIATAVYERYSADDTAVHLVGYLDGEGNGVSGIEKSFDELLKEYSGSFSVRYSADATGVSLGGLGLEAVSDNYASSGGIVLTVDSEIQRACENAMQWNGLDNGAVVVLDVQTSEILALASAPEFDRADLGASLSDDNSPFLNRALSAYAVGSVFKPVVAAAAIEKGLDTDTFFDCNGYQDVSGVRFYCHNRAGHGVNCMASALAVSCNSYFISLGKAVGAQDIISLASELGFGQASHLCDAVVSSSGNLPFASEIDSLPSLANLSFGQGELLATPLQIAAVYCAFANGGYYREPYVLKNMVNGDGEITAYYKNETNNKILPDSVCEKIVDMLTQTVESGSGKLASPISGTAAGKTATAETGIIKNGKEKVHTWFAGFYPAENPEYVIVVFREDGASSSTDCAPVFRDIADEIIGK